MRFASGQPKNNYDYLLELVVTERIQIRHNSLEAARLAANKTMSQAGDMSFFGRLRVYPHVILRVKQNDCDSSEPTVYKKE